MSRIFEALQQSMPEMAPTGADPSQAFPDLLTKINSDVAALSEAPSFRIPTSPESRLFASNAPNSLGAEKIRSLVGRLRHAQKRRGLKRVLVTSAVRGEGKSMMSSNLAITLAAYGEETLLIDGDLHKPALARLFGVNPPERSFANWWSNRDNISRHLFRSEGMPLWFLPAGMCREQPLAMIQSVQTAELIKQLGDWFSWIIIDSPPLAALSDASIWASMSDAVLLLLRQGKTPKKQLSAAMESLDKSKIFGVVLNDAKSTEGKYYREYYSGAPHQAPVSRAATAK